jgi:hypothetical protein
VLWVLTGGLISTGDREENMRRALVATAVAGLLLAGLVAVNVSQGARAQEPIEVVFVDSDVFDPDVNGYASIDAGTNDGVLGVECGGSNPQGGTAQIPSQVMTQLGAAQIRLRVFNNIGQRVTSLVRTNCTFDALVPSDAAAQQLKAKLTG